MKHFTSIFFAFLIVFGSHSAEAGVSFTIGTDDFYLSVGDYDYLPYAFVSSPTYVAPRISFYEALNDYGYWAQIPSFGQVWVPYASHGWRPYTQGHWIWTSHGWYWQAYEPWGWLAYHYGNWIWHARYGWVWLPDYEWHPGRVVWARGYDTIGWMPAPPTGYDYSRGYLAYVGPQNQFSYYDDDFDYYDDDYSYGGPYYDPRYRDLYYNPNYQQVGINLWVFIGNAHFGYDNYADYYLDRDYTRYVFDRRVIRISSRPVDRVVVERVVKQRIVEIPVVERSIETDRRRVRVIVPLGGEEEKVRRHANRVVKEVIAPAFVEKQKTFKDEKSKNKDVLAKIFKQENKPRKVETVNGDVIIQRATEVKKIREGKRLQSIEKEKQVVERIEKEGKVRQPKAAKKHQDSVPPSMDRDSQFQQGKKQKKVEPPDEPAIPKKQRSLSEAPSQEAVEAEPTKKRIEPEVAEAEEADTEEEVEAVEENTKAKKKQPASKKKDDSKKKTKDQKDKKKPVEDEPN